MATFCIPKQIAENLKKAARSGEVNVKDLYESDSAGRRATFEKFVGDKALAQQINGEFEAAMISKSKDALASWVKKTMDIKTDKKAYKGVLERINDLDELGVLNPKNVDDFLKDLVATKLGATITAEEVKVINEKSKVLDREANKGVDSFGLPSIEYFKARKDMDNYLDTLAPTSRLKVATSTIGRGSMLASLKSPITNIVGNTSQAIFTAFERRMSSGQYAGANNDLAKNYVRRVWEIYQKSGFDPSRMLDINDGGRKTLGEDRTSAQGEGTVRKIGRVYEDVVFKQLMGAPDVAFAASHFADSANLASTALAKREGFEGAGLKKRAAEIFTDATKFEPTTDEGILVRSQAIADAQYATYTNDSWSSKVSLAIRGVLNEATGDMRLGDNLMPFVKTPANVVESGMDFGGLGFLKAIVSLKKAMAAKKVGSVEVQRQEMKSATRSAIRSGLGLTTAAIVSSFIDQEDFIGAYPTSEKERQLLEAKNAVPNSIRIGGKWVSLDYFGALAAPLVGMLYAKKYGGVSSYVKGASSQFLKIPGIELGKDLYENIGDALSQEKTSSELASEALNSSIDFIRSRVIPGIVNDIARGTDSSERKTNVDDDPLAKVKGSIPGLRDNLPEDKTSLGADRPTESLISTLLFGSRVKTAVDDKVVNELDRLNRSGQLPSIADVEKSSSRVKEYKTQVDEKKYQEMITYFGSRFRSESEKLIDSGKYKSADNDEKKKLIEKAREDALETALTRHGYKKPKK